MKVTWMDLTDTLLIERLEFEEFQSMCLTHLCDMEFGETLKLGLFWIVFYQVLNVLKKDGNVSEKVN